jgi:hypothetical protein
LERAPLSAIEQSNNTQSWIPMADSDSIDALRAFSEACRAELQKFRVI